MRIAIYTRVSTDGQDAQNQLLQLRAYCQQQKWEIAHEYTDTASGGRGDRESLQELLADAAKRRFDVVLVWALDRLSREGAYETLSYLQRLANTGTKFVSYTEPYISTIGPLGDGIIALLASFAKLEKDRIRERTLAGLAKAKAAGRVGGRRRVIAPADLERVRGLRAEGMSFGKIATATGFNKSTIHLAMRG